MAVDAIVPLSSLAGEPAATWRWLKAAWSGSPAPPVVAVIGCGDGAVLDALAAHAPATRVLALEPNPALAARIANHPLWQAWRASGRLVYLAGPDYAGADQAWRIFPTTFEAPALVIHPDLQMGPEVGIAAEVLKKILVGADANAKARQRFAPRYLINSLRNLPAIITGPSVHRLRHAFTGIPAIVVGAGPSLDRAYDDLRAAAGKAVIIATDTSLRPLLVNGITPHLVVGLDPSDVNARHFFALPECKDTWLVAESALDHRATAIFSDRTFWCAASDHHPWPWLRQLGAEPAQLDVWGSVLTGAFQVACLAGCDPVVTVGADMAFTGGQPYARGTTYEFDWAWAAAFGTGIDDTWRASMQRTEIQLQADLHGAGTPTTPVLLAFRDWILAQAKKGGRRIVNASGAGMMFGPGIEQAKLSDVVGDPITIPSFGALAVRRSDIRPSAVARDVRALASDLKEARNTSPLPEWADFSGNAFDAAAVAAALDASATWLETKRGRPAAPASISWDLLGQSERSMVLGNLPELIARMRFALRSAPSPGSLGPRSEGGPVLRPLIGTRSPTTTAERSDLLLRALELLRQIADEALRGDDFVSWPDPTIVGDVPAGGVGMWPETMRWSVLVFEGLLGNAWHRIEERPECLAFASGPVSPAGAGESRAEYGARKGAAGQGPRGQRPFAAHACVQLVLEWCRSASSLEGTGAVRLRGAVDRLASLEGLMRTWPPPEHAGALADLVVEATGFERATVLVLPLGLSEAVLARISSGAAREEPSQVWDFGGASVDGLTVKIGLRAERGSSGRAPKPSAPSWPSARAKVLTPRVLTHPLWPTAVVTGQVGDDALCVTPFGTETTLVKPDGSLVPYQTWPRAITGALSLGSEGDVAWSNVLSPKPAGPRPYLMYRATPDANVEMLELPFRPSAGVWWRGRLYFNCQPTPTAKGGVGSWAPDGDIRFELPDLTLFPIVASENALALQPYVLGGGDSVLRQEAPRSWTWTPGEATVERAPGPFGGTSSVAIAGEWTAAAHPQADLVTLATPGEPALTIRCYYPLRLAWSGSSLVVCTAERELLLFENLLLTL